MSMYIECTERDERRELYYVHLHKVHQILSTKLLELCYILYESMLQAISKVYVHFLKQLSHYMSFTSAVCS